MRPQDPALVERDSELASLVAALAHPPAVAVVEGEPGIGKTRLVREALADPALAGRQQLTGSARPALAACPLGPVIEALATVTRPPARRLSALTGVLRTVLPELAGTLPPAPPPLPDPQLLRHRLVRAAAELLAKLGPTILILEDLHWADDATAELLQLIGARPPAELSVAVTCAFPGFAHQGPVAAHIRLAPLSTPAAGRLASHILGDPAAAVPRQLADLLYRRNGGVPLAVREDVLLLRGRGLLRRVNGTWAKRPASLPALVPPAVAAEIATRAAALTPDAAAALDAAAVLAEQAEPGLVAALAGLDAERTCDALAGAARHGLLLDQAPDAAPVRFRHELARLAVYQAMCGHHRRGLIRRLLGLAGEALHLGRYRSSLALAERARRLATEVGSPAFDQQLHVATLRVRWATGELTARQQPNGPHPAPDGPQSRLLRAQIRAGQGELGDARQALCTVIEEARAAVDLATAAHAAAELSRVALTSAQRRLAHAQARQVLNALAGAGAGAGRPGLIWAAPLLPFMALDLLRETLPAYRDALAGRDAPLARAALSFAEARVSEEEGDPGRAAGGYGRARLGYEALPDPRLAAHAGAREVRAQLAAGQPPDVDLLRQAWRTFTGLGATWDANRLASLMRVAGLPLPHRRGRPGYGNQLSPREREIADLAAAGHTNRDIAEKLYLSDCTVKYHVANAMRKLAVTSRRQLRDALEPGMAANGSAAAPGLRDHTCRCGRCGRELTHTQWMGYPFKTSPILAEKPVRRGAGLQQHNGR